MIIQILKENGAIKVYVMATHGILSNDAPSLVEVILRLIYTSE